MDSNVTVRELATVAAELNRMAAGLETAQAELMRSTEERIALERQVRQAEKLAMIGHLAAGLAHEIGAPLHVIRGRADLLLSRSESPRPEDRDLRIIVEQIDRITRIVRKLLDFARQGEPKLAPLDVVPLAESVLELVAVELRRAGIEARCTGIGCAPVMGDRDQLQQVVLNLVLNASQALSEVDGRRAIEVRISRDDSAGNDEVVVQVIDSGPGIPAKYQGSIFDPFFSTKSDGLGTGLGLVVARRIVEDHRGRLSVASGKAGETALAVRLPAHNGALNGA
jgi:signal transduction histidine kinase